MSGVLRVLAGQMPARNASLRQGCRAAFAAKSRARVSGSPMGPWMALARARRRAARAASPDAGSALTEAGPACAINPSSGRICGGVPGRGAASRASSSAGRPQAENRANNKIAAARCKMSVWCGAI